MKKISLKLLPGGKGEIAVFLNVLEGIEVARPVVVPLTRGQRLTLRAAANARRTAG